MRRWLLILSALVAAQVLAIGFLALLLYQTTPNSVLARETIIGRIPGVLALTRLADRSLNVLYRGQSPDEPLPHYHLDVDPEDLQMIEENLPTELPSKWYGNLFLEDDNKQWAKGIFSADGKEYDVKVRVRGDLFNHWAYRKKSWRIKFKKDDLFRGMRAINLIIPEDRGWIAEPLNVYRAEKFDLLHPPTRFVTMSLNRSGPMLYTEIEHWGKEMLEKQGRPGDVNLYQTEGGTSTFSQWDAVFTDVAYWDKYESDASGTDSYEEIVLLQELSQPGAHREQGFEKKLRSIVDVDRTIDWYVLSLLAGSRHVLDHNMRFFFDTARGRIEPIPWDTFLYGPHTLLSPPGNPFLVEVFSVPEIKLEAYRRVWEYVRDDDNVEDDLQQAAALRRSMEAAAYRDSVKLPSNRQVRSALDSKESMLRANFTHLEEELRLSEVLVSQHLPSREGQAEGIVLTIDVTSRGISPARFSGAVLPGAVADSVRLVRDGGDGIVSADDEAVTIIGRSDPDEDDRVRLSFAHDHSTLVAPGPAEQINGRPEAPHTTTRFFLVGPSDLDPSDLPLKLMLRNAVTGKKADVIGEVLVDESTFADLDAILVDRDAFLRTHPQFRPVGASDVSLQGTVSLSRTVLLPLGVGLTVAPGTRISMGPDVSLVARGPVQLVGTENRPITISPAGAAPWGVFAVLNAKAESSVAFTTFRGGSEATILGTVMTGMAAFHGSPVTVRDSIFTDAHGDDGLNLKYVSAAIERSHFERNSFDGLDVDFAPGGFVRDSIFLDNGNDGIDLSWSPLRIEGVLIERSGDKCLSVGEKSEPIAVSMIVRGCATGIAVKDASTLTLKDSLVEDNAVGIDAYIKKPIFGPPSVTVSDTIFTDNGDDTRTSNGATITIR